MLGPSGFTTVVTAARGGCEALDVTVEDLVESGDRAAARLRWSGTGPSGEPLERETLEMVRIREGLAVAQWGGLATSPARDSTAFLVRTGPGLATIGPMVRIELERIEALELLGMTLAHLNDAEARGEVSPRVPLLMVIRDKFASALREGS